MAISFIQRFGSALQLNVHIHVLVPDGVFDGAGAFEHLAPPDDADVEGVLETFLLRLRALLEGRGLIELEALPDDALDARTFAVDVPACNGCRARCLVRSPKKLGSNEIARNLCASMMKSRAFTTSEARVTSLISGVRW